jgi:hypothetical protein
MASYTLLLDIPRCASAQEEFKCFISGGLLLHPVRGADGKVYERVAVDMWVGKYGDRSPCNNGPFLPLTPITDPTFLHAVSLLSPDPPPPLRADTEITINIVLPSDDHRVLTVRLSDTLLDVVRRVKPMQRRLLKEDGTLFNIPDDTATLDQCRINDGDTLYFPL